MENHLSANYWNERISKHDMPWDIGYPSTPLKNYIDSIDDKNISVLIPGCGNAYEAEYMLQNGFTNLTLIDIAEEQTAALKERLHSYKNFVQIITGDFFNHSGKYDLILEQTFFCALDPSLRNAYADKMCKLLNPRGKLAGVLFTCFFAESPPYGGNISDYQKIFSDKFNIQKLEICYNSISRRAGNECFIVLKSLG